jgi:hypothetical protein
VSSPISKFYADIQDLNISSSKQNYRLTIKIIQSHAVIDLILSNNYADDCNRMMMVRFAGTKIVLTMVWLITGTLSSTAGQERARNT